jgi:hypothetical protein
VAPDTTFTVEISTDLTQTWTVLRGFGEADNHEDWTQHRISLDGHQGDLVMLRFRVIQGASAFTDQWLIDDCECFHRSVVDRRCECDGTRPADCHTNAIPNTDTYTAAFSHAHSNGD